MRRDSFWLAMVNKKGVCFAHDLLSGRQCTHSLSPILNLSQLIHLTKPPSNQLPCCGALLNWCALIFCIRSWDTEKLIKWNTHDNPQYTARRGFLLSLCSHWVLWKLLLWGSDVPALVSLLYPAIFFFLVVFWELQFFIGRRKGVGSTLALSKGSIYQVDGWLLNLNFLTVRGHRCYFFNPDVPFQPISIGLVFR